MESYPSIIGNILKRFSEGIWTIFDSEDERELNFKADDLVLIQTGDTTRAFWPLARIIETHVAHDGNLRSVKLKLPNRR